VTTNAFGVELDAHLDANIVIASLRAVTSAVKRAAG